MAGAKRERRERTDNWELSQQWCCMPEQRLYESIRPITIFGIPPGSPGARDLLRGKHEAPDSRQL